MGKKYKIQNKLQKFKVLKGEIPKLINQDLAYDEKVVACLDALDSVMDGEIVYQGLKASEIKVNWKDLITGALVGGLGVGFTMMILLMSGVI